MHTPTRSAAQPSTLSVRPLQPYVGAEVSGVDLREPLTAALRDEIYAALLRYKVIFFRDQPLTREQHIALGSAFGELEAHPVEPTAGYPLILEVKADGVIKRGPDIWHTDNMYEAVPPSVSILRAITIPKLGGDTAFSNAIAAYESLDAETKAKIEHLKAECVFPAKRRKDLSPERKAELAAKYPTVEFPVVRIHPDTGERTLFVCEAYSENVIGLEAEESAQLLRLLFDRIKRPENQVRFAWRVNSIAMWDNRAVQHYAVTDYSEPRHLERVTAKGTKPFGPGEAGPKHPLPPL
jgi:alpha-ketoglutarate-dependent taurine dioxygenase